MCWSFETRVKFLNSRWFFNRTDSSWYFSFLLKLEFHRLHWCWSFDRPVTITLSDLHHRGGCCSSLNNSLNGIPIGIPLGGIGAQLCGTARNCSCIAWKLQGPQLRASIIQLLCFKVQFVPRVTDNATKYPFY